MKKCFFATVFLIANLFSLHSKSPFNDGTYSPYSYSYQTYSLFPSEEDNNSMYPSFSEEKSNYPVDYELINYELNLDQEEGQITARGLRSLPPGFETYDAIGTELPVGNLIPLVFFSGIYVCRIILKKRKKTQQSLPHN